MINTIDITIRKTVPIQGIDMNTEKWYWYRRSIWTL